MSRRDRPAKMWLGVKSGPQNPASGGGSTSDHTISGDVVEDGTLVTLTGDASDSMTTSGDGLYSFTGLAPGDYTVTPTLDDYTFTPTSRNITVEQGTDQTGADFVAASFYLVLPYLLQFDSETTDQKPEGWTDETVYGGYGEGGSGNVSPTVITPCPDDKQFGTYRGVTTKCLQMIGDIGTEKNSSITKPLGGAIDMRAGIRFSWTMRHAHESGDQSSCIFILPLFTTDKTTDFLRFAPDWSLTNESTFNWNESTASKLNDTITDMIVSADFWMTHRVEINFAAGTWFNGAYRAEAGNSSGQDQGTGTFAAQAGPSTMNTICLCNRGSAWNVYDDIYLQQLWIGSLTDDWPHHQQKWSL